MYLARNLTKSKKAHVSTLHIDRQSAPTTIHIKAKVIVMSVGLEYLCKVLSSHLENKHEGERYHAIQQRHAIVHY